MVRSFGGRFFADEHDDVELDIDDVVLFVVVTALANEEWVEEHDEAIVEVDVRRGGGGREREDDGRCLGKCKGEDIIDFLFFCDDDDNDFVVDCICDVCEVMEDDREVLFKVGGMLF